MATPTNHVYLTVCESTHASSSAVCLFSGIPQLKQSFNAIARILAKEPRSVDVDRKRSRTGQTGPNMIRDGQNSYLIRPTFDESSHGGKLAPQKGRKQTINQSTAIFFTGMQVWEVPRLEHRGEELDTRRFLWLEHGLQGHWPCKCG